MPELQVAVKKLFLSSKRFDVDFINRKAIVSYRYAARCIQKWFTLLMVIYFISNDCSTEILYSKML